MGTSSEYDNRSDEKHSGAIEVSADDIDTGAAVASGGDADLDPLEALRVRCVVRTLSQRSSTEALPIGRR
jgi:ethanolamine utilization microcompartment shell protein EutL